VIPDRPSGRLAELVEKARPGWTGPLDLMLLPRPERWFLPFMKSGSRNHGLQVVSGVSSADSTHVILHDADLFLMADSLLDDQYRHCRDRELACLGVSPVWDPWFETKGLRLAATWEMVASIPWLRSFPPYRHIGHDAVMFGERHTFDTTLFAQAATDPSRVDYTDRGADFVHFNYVVTTYRHFQRHGPGFEDRNFRLLLIALFAHLFSQGAPPRGLPSLDELSTDAGRPGATVRYPRDGEAPARRRDFRGRLNRLLDADLVAPKAARDAARALARFDQLYR
jgi:hypothetical protein